MTHTHVRLAKPGPASHRSYWPDFAIGGVLVVLIALYAVNQLWIVPQRTAYSYTYGSVTEARIVVTRTQESTSGGRIYYQIQAHVRFDLNGQAQDRWLPASDETTAREFLTAQLTPQPTKCRVYWPPDHPQDLKCRLR